MREEEKLLIENLKAQAKYFLEDAGEFYPFGAALDLQYEIKPLSVYLNEEFPTSEMVLKELEIAIKKKLEEGNYIEAAIGFDVNIKDNKGKSSALRVKIISRDDKEKYYDYPYIFSPENKVLFT